MVVRSDYARWCYGCPISIRLDDDVRHELEAQAQSRGIGPGTLLRDLATRAARDVRRARIRDASQAVADHVADTLVLSMKTKYSGSRSAGLRIRPCAGLRRRAVPARLRAPFFEGHGVAIEQAPHRAGREGGAMLRAQQLGQLGQADVFL